jgi:hypothetical protein
MTLRLNPGDVYLTNYTPWNAKYRYEFPDYVGLVIDMYMYPIPYSEFEKIRYGDASIFTLMTEPERNGDYYSYEIIKTSSNLVNQDFIISKYLQYWYCNYHPNIDVLIIWATDDPNGDILPEPKSEPCPCDECLKERGEFQDVLSPKDKEEYNQEEICDCDDCLASREENNGEEKEYEENNKEEYNEEEICYCDDCLASREENNGEEKEYNEENEEEYNEEEICDCDDCLASREENNGKETEYNEENEDE